MHVDTHVWGASEWCRVIQISEVFLIPPLALHTAMRQPEVSVAFKELKASISQ